MVALAALVARRFLREPRFAGIITPLWNRLTRAAPPCAVPPLYEVAFRSEGTTWYVVPREPGLTRRAYPRPNSSYIGTNGRRSSHQ